MNSGKQKRWLWTAPLLLLLTPLIIFTSPLTQEKQISIPDTETIEQELLNLINKEREHFNRPLLELSIPLSDMARRHSLDMARQDRPSHLSSNGKTLINRLEDAGFYYIDAGENVAFSETFMAEFIHKGIFGSGGHRENILDPNFTHVGIGVVQQDQEGYYITQDFMRPLQYKSNSQIRQIVLDQVNTERGQMSLPPLELWQEVEQFANEMAQRKTNNLDLLKIPSELGETFIVFLSTPSLTQKELDFPEAVNPRYNRGVLGVWFGKNEDYPGGVYGLALMLSAENVSLTLSPEEQKLYILELINKIRTNLGLKSLSLDDGLTQAAERMVSKAARRRDETPIIPEYEKYRTLTYGTEDLSLLPSSLDSMVKKTQLRKIGIGIAYKKNPGGRKGMFFISLIFE